MTGISDISETLRSIQQQSKNKTKTTANDLFKTTFEKVLSADTPVKAEQNSALPPLGEINAINFNIIESPEKGLTNKTNELLNKLDSYSHKLGDPNTSLKEIEPLILEIKEEATKLSLEIKKSGNNNPELISIADKSALAANIEHLKFMRGDYLPDDSF